MELEQLISAARERLGETNASDRTIENFFNNPLFRPAEGTEPDEPYWERTIGTLKWFSDNYQGQHNHEMSVARSTWEEEWKKNHPDPAVPQPPKPQEKPAEQITEAKIAEIVAKAIAANKPAEDPRVVALQKQIQEMNTANEAREAKLIIDGLYSSVKSKIMNESNGEADLVELEDAIEYVQMKGSITKDTAPDVAEKIIRDRYEKQFKRHNPGGESPYGISASGGGSGETFAQTYLKKKLELEKQRQESVNAQRARFK